MAKSSVMMWENIIFRKVGTALSNLAKEVVEERSHCLFGQLSSVYSGVASIFPAAGNEVDMVFCCDLVCMM